MALIISFVCFKSINGKNLAMTFPFELVFHIDWRHDHENLGSSQL